MTDHEKLYIDKLNKASTMLSIWAEDMIKKHRWSVADIKLALRNGAKIV